MYIYIYVYVYIHRYKIYMYIDIYRIECKRKRWGSRFSHPNMLSRHLIHSAFTSKRGRF